MYFLLKDIMQEEEGDAYFTSWAASRLAEGDDPSEVRALVYVRAEKWTKGCPIY